MDDASVETTTVEAAPAELRVLVVDDHTTFAELLSFALSTEQGLSCVGTASNAAEGIVLVQELRPDIVIMDIEMPRQDGLAACRRIREVAPDTVIAVVTAHREPDWVVRATQAGASAFIPKNGSLTEMLDVLRRARSGSMLIAPSAFALTGATTRQNPAMPSLTRRERDVLACLGRGMAPKAIARILGISVHTCRGYVKSLLSKLDVSSQLEAVVKAQELGMLDEPR
jgi:DNA-binding NarL/FixJ family response regulator